MPQSTRLSQWYVVISAVSLGKPMRALAVAYSASQIASHVLSAAAGCSKLTCTVRQGRVQAHNYAGRRSRPSRAPVVTVTELQSQLTGRRSAATCNPWASLCRDSEVATPPGV